MNSNAKEGFGSKVGFVMAAAGSAVGLGNIWRFPYLAARYGGGIFLIVYLALTVTFGFSLMLTEIAIGRRTGSSAIGAYRKIDRRFSALGVLSSVVPLIITPYYCVIGGWVLKYFFTFLTGMGASAAGDGAFFTGFIASTGDATLFFLIFLALTAAAVFMGVKKGIELLSKIMMPVLIALVIGVAVYTLTLPGAAEGLRYYLLPDLAGFTVGKMMKTLVAAMGQMFYSLSIAMGILITYGSYMRREDSLEGSVRQIEVFDTAVAFLAGAIIVPAVFVFSGGDASQLNAGPGLMFITLPNVFASMRGGQIVGAAFFLLVSLAALTSSISLMEAVVSIISERFRLERKKSAAITSLLLIVIGMLSVLGYSAWSDARVFGYQILDFFDFISNNVLMPVVSLITCLLIGWVVKTKYVEDEVSISGQPMRAKKLYRVMILAVCPVFMLLILFVPFFVEL